MRIFFCTDCGGYSLGPAEICDECHAELSEDGWADITEEDLQQLDYVDEFDLPPGVPTWEYDVVKLKTDNVAGGAKYTSEILRRMGETGWELVNIVPLGHDDGSGYGVFKRSWEREFED